MSKYYSLGKTESSDNQQEPVSRENSADKILCHELWKGRLHGSPSTSFHARHLRPLCELVSSSEYLGYQVTCQ
jgi:hypothetical protein